MELIAKLDDDFWAQQEREYDNPYSFREKRMHDSLYAALEREEAYKRSDLVDRLNAALSRAISLQASVMKLEAVEGRLKGHEAEKFRRMYYQGIVYAVCLWIDSIEGNKAGAGVVCGTYETPSEGIEEALERIGSNLKALRVIKGINNFTEEEEKELDSLRSRAEAAEGQLCRAREALRIGILAPQPMGAELNVMKDAYRSSAPCRHAALAEGKE